MRIDYVDPRHPQKPIQWMWKFVSGARTAVDLYGRAPALLAGEQHASRLVVPASQQHPPLRWPSHRDRARKAVLKLAAPHLPATPKQLEKAIEPAHAEHDTATSRARKTKHAGARTKPETAAADVNDSVAVTGDGELEPGSVEDPSR